MSRADLTTTHYSTSVQGSESGDQSQPECNSTKNNQSAQMFPMSFAQQRLWFLNDLGEENSAYQLPFGLKITGVLQAEILQQSLTEITRRHESLRTSFGIDNFQPVQLIAPQVKTEISFVDLTHLPEEEKQSRLHQLIEDQSRQPFNLNIAPLFNTSLFKLNQTQHVFLFNIHHIIFDGWSFTIFIEELAALYQAYSQQTKDSLTVSALSEESTPGYLTEQPLQYVDFTLWQNQLFQEGFFEQQLSYWKKQLSNAPDDIQLLVENRLDVVENGPSKGARLSVQLDKKLTDQLKIMCQEQRVTLFMLLLTAFKVLLHRYSEAMDICIATPVANRKTIEVEGIVGLFLNSLVIRSDLSNNPDFISLLAQVKQTSLDAFDNQDLPFNKLVEALDLKSNTSVDSSFISGSSTSRYTSANPLYRIMFVLLNAPLPELNFAGLQLEPMEIDTGTSMLDLTLFIRESKQAIIATAEFNTDLFDHKTVARMLTHLHTILASAVIDPQQKISKIPLLTTQEENQLLQQWNDTEQNYPLDDSISTLFENQVQQTPDAIAISRCILAGQSFLSDKEQSIERLTYLELNQRANQLAHHLLSLDITQGQVVGVYLDRSPEMIIAMIAIFKAGAVYLPLPPEYPKKGLLVMLEDSQPSIVLTKQRFIEQFLNYQTQLICLDFDRSDRKWQDHQIAQHSLSNIAQPTKLHDRAYILYTSGSTGQPKGVCGTHYASLNRLHWMWQTYPFAEGEICCQRTSLSFIDSIFEILNPLLKGVPLVIISDDYLKEPQYLVQLLAAKRISRIVLMPMLIKLILEYCTLTEQSLPHLKYLLSSGEALSPALVKQFKITLPHVRLLNLYGSSEVSDVLWCDVTDQDTSTTVPIGRPIANTQVYILSDALQPVPVLVAGDLYIAGAPLSQGYLNNPELTAECFIDNPKSFDSLNLGTNNKLYKTGDRARYRDDGHIELLGRKDSQVKIRGYRIEPNIIEAQLENHPELSRVAVITFQDLSGDNQLAAYFVTDNTSDWNMNELSSTALRNYLTDKLPAYMIPAIFIPLDLFSLTPSGKVDKHALPSVKPYLTQFNIASVQPSTSIEKELVPIWYQILGHDQFGIDDSFFDLGGHSLKASQLLWKIQELYSVEIRLREFFKSPCIRHLAVMLEQKLIDQLSSDDMDKLLVSLENN